MRLADLLRRTSFRLAVLFAVLILLALGLAGAVAWVLIGQQLGATQDRRVNEIASDLIAIYEVEGPSGLAAAIARRSSAPDAPDVLRLLHGRGTTLAGDPGPPLPALAPGHHDLSPRTAGRSDDLPLRMEVVQVGDDTLLVGLADEDLDEVGEIVSGAFGWAVIAVLIVALGGGAVIAARVEAVIGGVEGTMDRVAAGDLSARIPVEPGTGDLTRLAHRINAALTRLEGVVEGMRQVSADISHELRTPLVRLRLRLEAAAEVTEGSPAASDVAAALAHASAIEETFAALLRIAQIEAGARRDRFAPLNLATLLSEVVETYEGVAEEAGMRLRLVEASSAPVRGDRGLLLQALGNLVENALRHCPAGTTVSCAVNSVAGTTTLSVTDDGPGIPAAERARVTDRFYRLDRSRSAPGTGLGLALVKAVADLHGAALDFNDAVPGLRARLRFLPACD